MLIVELAAATFLATQREGWHQIVELATFTLSFLIGLERQLRGKAAGLCTQSIVGTASALFLLVSKYGFTDVLAPGVSFRSRLHQDR